MFLQLAWRNLWRNKRRTLISMSAVGLAVLFASVIQSFQKGSWDHMVDNIARYYLGYAQIHQAGFWDDQTLDNSFATDEVPPALHSQLDLTPRLESFALASSGEITRGVLVVGVDPAKENAMTGLAERLTRGQYLDGGTPGVLVADGLAELLKLSVGDTIILISQGYQGRNAAGAYPIRGMARFASPELNKQMVFLPLGLAQEFYGTGDRLTSLAVNLPEGRDDLPEALAVLETNLNEDEFEVMDYMELLPELLEAQELDTAGGMLIMWVLYLLIAFGLFGTVLMMTRERTYEFGVLLAIGTKKKTLAGMLWAEALFIGVVGAGAGLLLSLPVVWYLNAFPIQLGAEFAEAYAKYGLEPVLKATFSTPIFLRQAITIFFISSALALYPLWYIWQLRGVTAMRA